jgi:hypothetical protein
MAHASNKFQLGGSQERLTSRLTCQPVEFIYFVACGTRWGPGRGGIAYLPGLRLIRSACRGSDAWTIRIAIREQLVGAARALDGPRLPAADVWLRSRRYPKLHAQDPGARAHVVPCVLASNVEPQSLGVTPSHVHFRPSRHEHSFAYAYPRCIRISWLLYVCDV